MSEGGSRDGRLSFFSIHKLITIACVLFASAWSANAATITVPVGGSVQSAINAAQYGDTIIVQAGAVYTGNIVLPLKSGTGEIVIQSSRISELPEGVRVDPSQSALFAKFQSVTPAEPVVRTAAGAHHYRFQGIEFSTANASVIIYDIVRFGGDRSSQTTLSSVPHHLVIDRCYIHGFPTQDSQRGVSMNSAESTVSNSYISEIHTVGIEAQAIGAWNGPGPLHIINNYLEGAGENIMIGGSDSASPDLMPANIRIIRNHMFKPLSWKVGDPSYAGKHWTVKNILELKAARNVVIDGNVLENIWVDAQDGSAVLFTVRNQECKAPWSTVENVTYTNNTLKNVEGTALNLLGMDNEVTAAFGKCNPASTSGRGTGAYISNNVFYNIKGAFIQLNGFYNVTLDHNTSFQNSNTYTLYGEASLNHVSTNNLTIENPYGIFGDGGYLGTAGLTHYTPSFVFNKNLMVGAAANFNPAGNFYPANVSDVGFLDFAGGNYGLSASSPYKNAGTDGKDIGVDFAQLNAALGGTSTPAPTPTPNSTPTPTPTPTPSPTPTPTPVPGAPLVTLTVPVTGASFVAPANITLTATASDVGGSITKVEFYRGGDTLIATDTSSPYSAVWNNVSKGKYNLTARATDNSGLSTTSVAVSITVTNSPNSVNKAKGRANNLAQQSQSQLQEYAGAAGGSYIENTALASDITLLTDDITQAYAEFQSESGAFGKSVNAIDTHLRAAMLFSKASTGLSLRAASSPNITNNLLRIASHLAIAEDLMRFGVVSQTTANKASSNTARIDVVVGKANIGYALTAISSVAPASLASISGSGNLQPMTSQTRFASIVGDGNLPYEVGGLSVTVNGVAAPVVYASPWGIKFFVPGDVPVGIAEVIVSSQDGYICLGTVSVERNGSMIMTRSEDVNGAIAAANGHDLIASDFNVVTSANFGTDKRTRVIFFATGISGSAVNSDSSNDINIGGKVRPNFAESVTVEARLGSGQVFTLPVKYAGIQGTLPGLDQITTVLIPQLQGAGTVQLTLIVGGRRSNAPTIFIK